MEEQLPQDIYGITFDISVNNIWESNQINY